MMSGYVFTGVAFYYHIKINWTYMNVRKYDEEAQILRHISQCWPKAGNAAG